MNDVFSRTKRKRTKRRQIGGDTNPEKFIRAVIEKDFPAMRNIIAEDHWVINTPVKEKKSDNYVTTPLIAAIEHAHEDVIVYLLDNDADPNMVNGKNVTPLHTLCENIMKLTDEQLIRFATLLVAHGANIYQIDSSDGMDTTLLHECVTGYNLPMLKFLVNSGVDVDMVDASLSTPLVVALSFYEYADTDGASAEDKLTEIIKYLIPLTDVNIMDISGDTALHYATYTSNIEFITMILSAGANVNAKNYDGETPLFHIKSVNISSIIPILLDAGADINERNNSGATTLYNAILEGYDSIATELITAGADVNIIYIGTHTVLCLAVYKNNMHIIQALVNAGADVNRGENDQIPLYIAAKKDYIDIVKYLIRHGAAVNDRIRENAGPRVKKYLASKPWAGFTRGDLQKLDTIFDPAAGPMAMQNISICPVCLMEYRREVGCNYMTHNCFKENDYYHYDLYNKYKNPDGTINWCTVCGRICKGHGHYKLAPFDAPVPPLLPTMNVYAEDCRIDGGGGVEEKIMRFRTLREVARNLQLEIGEKTRDDALDELVEEMWNPMPRPRIVERILARREFNIPLNVFPERAAQEAANSEANTPVEVVEPPPGIREEPLVSDGPGENAMTAEDDLPVITFRHANRASEVITHSAINKNSVIIHIRRQGDATGFHCFECDGLLWPQEIAAAFAHPSIRDSITDDERHALVGYTERFNRYFATHPLPYRGAAAAAGGGGDELQPTEDVFKPMKYAQCVGPRKPMRAGRMHRTTKRRPRGLLRRRTAVYKRKVARK